MKYKQPATIYIALPLVLLMIIIVSTIPKTGKFQLKNSSPSNKQKNFETSKPIIINFTKYLDESLPFSSFTISPKIDGIVSTAGSKLVFTPKGEFVSNTGYSVKVSGAKSIVGEILPNIDFTFTAGKQVMSSFEKQLPYENDSFIAERLSDATIVLTIKKIDEDDEIVTSATEFLATKGIKPERINVLFLER